MVQKVHGAVSPGEALGRNLQFFEINTATNILVGGASQKALDKLVEVISLRGQPVIMGEPTVDTGVYTFKFATEHYGAWTAETLKAAIVEHAGHAEATLTVTVRDLL